MNLGKGRHLRREERLAFSREALEGDTEEERRQWREDRSPRRVLLLKGKLLASGHPRKRAVVSSGNVHVGEASPYVEELHHRTRTSLQV